MKFCRPGLMFSLDWYKSRRSRCAGHVDTMEEGKNAFKVLTDTPTGKIPLGRPRRSWDDIIRMNHKEIGINMTNCVDLAQDANAALNLWVQ